MTTELTEAMIDELVDDYVSPLDRRLSRYENGTVRRPVRSDKQRLVRTDPEDDE